MPVMVIRGYLRDKNGVGLGGRTILVYVARHGFEFPPTPTVTVSTDSNGDFSAQLRIDPGTYRVKCEFAGDAVYPPVSKTLENVDGRVSTSISLTVGLGV